MIFLFNESLIACKDIILFFDASKFRLSPIASLDFLSKSSIETHPTNKNEVIRKRLIRFEDKIRLQNQVYKDLKNQFRKAIKNKIVKILRTKQRVVIRISSKILFRSGRAKVRKNGRPLLRKIASVIKRYSNREIQVQGHTDNVQIKGQLAEKWETNWELSTARATSVLRYLVEIGDVDPRNSSAAGLGEFNPIATNNSKKGKSLNRRIEIIIFPPDNR